MDDLLMRIIIFAVSGLVSGLRCRLFGIGGRHYPHANIRLPAPMARDLSFGAASAFEQHLKQSHAQQLRSIDGRVNPHGNGNGS